MGGSKHAHGRAASTTVQSSGGESKTESSSKNLDVPSRSGVESKTPRELDCAFTPSCFVSAAISVYDLLLVPRLLSVCCPLRARCLMCSGLSRSQR
jgi:hypothetical protein